MSAERAVQTVRETPVIPADDNTMMAVIARAAADPNTDVAKLHSLMDLYERIGARNARIAFASALAEMQPKLPVIDRNGRIEVPAKEGKTGHSTPYATWEDMNDAIRPILHDHGFALSFRIGQAQDGKITVAGVLSHREGHSEETTITLMHDSTGSKNAVQAVGSSTSYGKRYTAMALLNITSRAPQDRDDDADSAFPGDWISEDEMADLVALMDEVGADRTKFLNWLKIDTLARLPKKRLQEAIRALEAKRAR